MTIHFKALECVSTFRPHLNPREVISFDLNDRFFLLHQTLCDHNIMSAPVLDSNGKFIGFLEMCDLLEFLVRQTSHDLISE